MSSANSPGNGDFTNEEDARLAVAAVRENLGYLSQENLDHMLPHFRKQAERAMEIRDELCGQNIKVIAEQIYGSSARCIFELLQNADDNRFYHAQDRGDSPFVSFTVYPDRIVVECNEDGFTKRDLNALCSTGKSSKAGSSGYIGAKGIGFKSVFGVAEKVHISSGHLQFHLIHKPEDSGMGMITPTWDAQAAPLAGITRSTLYLLGYKSSSPSIKAKQDIDKQFAELHQSCLLFLRNLKRVKVSIRTAEDTVISEKEFSRGQVDSHRTFLDVEQKDSIGSFSSVRNHYHITNRKFSDVPQSMNRDPPPGEEGRKADCSTDVILAFPLSEDSAPVLEHQQVFAFLPIRTSSFKFLIQADFDTQASRQDVVTTSDRNQQLLDRIARVFIDAVLEFCDHTSLHSLWPRFLPDHEEPDPFWKTLVETIKRLVSEKRIFQSRHTTPLRRVSDIRRLEGGFQDGTGRPLLDDPDEDIFISSSYPSDCLDTLQRFGLERIDWSDVFRLVSHDLSKSSARIRQTPVDEDWHSRLARCLIPMASDARLRRLEFIPLEDGSWTAASSGPTFFPSTCGVSVPENTIKRTLHSTAISNNDREALFQALGAKEPEVRDVRSSILQENRNSSTISPRRSRDQLHYLYRTHRLRHDGSDLSRFKLCTTKEISTTTHENDIYIRNDDEFGPKNLLSPDENSDKGETWFLEPEYLQNIPPRSSNNHPTWYRWLYDTVGICERFRLLAKNGEKFSSEWEYVLNHRPHKALGLLKHLWPHDGPTIKRVPALVEQIADLECFKFCRPGTPNRFYLSHAYLPYRHLVELCENYMVVGEHFPFLDLPPSLTDEQLDKEWSFLATSFRVKKQVNWYFFDTVLFCIKTAHEESPVSNFQRLINVYISIDAQCLVEVNQEKLRSTVRKHQLQEFQGLTPNYRKSIANQNLVYVPPSPIKNSAWSNPDQCLLRAPRNMTTRHSLGPLYQGEAQEGRLLEFFRLVLNIRDANYLDIVAELKSLKTNGITDIDRILDLYRYVSEHSSVDEAQKIKESFQSNELVFVPSHAEWHKPSDCLWAPEIYIEGKYALGEEYNALSAFFRKVLQVSDLTIELLHQRLLDISPNEQIKDVESMLWTFNDFLKADATYLQPTRIRQAHVFPVKGPDGIVKFESLNTKFAIVDREDLHSHFQHKIKTLAFSMSEVRRLRPLIEWAEMSDRYLSASVKQITYLERNRGYTNTHPKRNLWTKAFAILRIAAMYGSPRYTDAESLYSLLRSIQVLETSGISSVLTISQDHGNIEVQKAQSELYIDDNGSTLEIYLLSEKKTQEFAFISLLPERFAEWLMTDPATGSCNGVEKSMITILTSLFSVHASTAGMLLTASGIIQIPLENVDEEVESLEDSPDLSRTRNETREEVMEDITFQQDDEIDFPNREPQTQPGSNSTAYSSSTSTRSPRASISESSSTAPAWTPGRTPSTEGVQESRRSLTPSANRGASITVLEEATSRLALDDRVRPIAPPTTTTEARDYRWLLNRVISAATSSDPASNFPSFTSHLDGARPHAEHGASLDSYDGTDITFGVITGSQYERRKRIGAAGELYVYKILEHTLPDSAGWSIENWMSRIRHYVKAHPSFSNLEPWHGSETADLVYHDVERHLTALLINSGYLDRQEWGSAQPTYYLEVKTTTGPCSTKFFMSKNQYRLMQEMHADAGKQRVYMILRVYDLESDGIGLRVYLDPEALRREDLLEFTAETWSVAPR